MLSHLNNPIGHDDLLILWISSLAIVYIAPVSQIMAQLEFELKNLEWDGNWHLFVLQVDLHAHEFERGYPVIVLV